MSGEIRLFVRTVAVSMMVTLLIIALSAFLCSCSGGGDDGNSSASAEVTNCYQGDIVYTFDSDGNVIQTRPLEESLTEVEGEDERGFLDREGMVILPQCGSDVTINIHEEQDNDVVSTDVNANLGINTAGGE